MDSATLAILFLALVGAALVCAALYALFAKPSSSLGKKRKQEIANGFQIAGGLLLAFGLMGTFVAFAGISVGVTSSTKFQVSRLLAGLIAGSALVAIGLMVQRWAKYFAGLIAWGILNSLMMASSGHLLNDSAIPVRRSLALIMAGLCFVTVLVTRRFTKAYRLHWAEKLALMAWIVAFALSANIERYSVPALTTGTFALFVAWWWHGSQSRRRGHQSIHRREPTADRP
jgi:hypothetical protein